MLSNVYTYTKLHSSGISCSVCPTITLTTFEGEKHTEMSQHSNIIPNYPLFQRHFTEHTYMHVYTYNQVPLSFTDCTHLQKKVKEMKLGKEPNCYDFNITSLVHLE